MVEEYWVKLCLGWYFLQWVEGFLERNNSKEDVEVTISCFSEQAFSMGLLEGWTTNDLDISNCTRGKILVEGLAKGMEALRVSDPSEPHWLFRFIKRPPYGFDEKG